MDSKRLITRSGTPYEVRGLTVDEALQVLEGGAKLIDVRSADDYLLTAIDHPSVENIPMLELLEKMETLDKQCGYLFTDMDGNLAWKAANMLLYNDFKEVWFVAGGVLQWKSAGLALKGKVPDLMNSCGDHSSCGGCSCGC